MITLSLLHPIKQVPVQVWTFPNETTIRIGRSTDNQVILYSAVVSRHHVELRRVGSAWEIVNLGTNGTYLDGKRITQVSVKDGAIIRLARSGPNIQIRIGEEAIKEAPKANDHDRTVSQGLDYPMLSTEITDRSPEHEDDVIELDEDGEALKNKGVIPVPPHLQLPPEAVTGIPSLASTAANLSAIAPKAFQSIPTRSSAPVCTHSKGGSLFCIDCGQPLHVLQTVNDYQILKVLGQGEIGITYQAWRAGQTLVLKTLNADWVNNPKATEVLECEADIIRHLNHPQVPHLVDFFSLSGQPYLVMELISGQTLTQRIGAEGPVLQEQAIAWLLKICEVLTYLHGFTPPVLHRSIKPNSLIRQTLPHVPDAIALVDFGTIKAMALGQIDPPVGTAGYNAPEQLDMEATPAVDFYPLGPLLAYLVTGQNPITFYADREQGYRFYADSIPGITPKLAKIIHILTSPHPEDRYATASKLADDLQETIGKEERG